MTKSEYIEWMMHVNLAITEIASKFEENTKTIQILKQQIFDLERKITGPQTIR